MASSEQPSSSAPVPGTASTLGDVYVTIAGSSPSQQNELRVPDGVINLSGLLLGCKDSGMLDDPPVRIPLVSDGHFSLADVRAVFDFIELLKREEPHVAEQRDAGVFPKEEIVLWVSDWTVKLLDDSPKDDVFRAINAAQYLQVPDFVHYAASYIAAEIRELNLTQLQAFLNVADDSGAPTLDRDMLRLIFRDALGRWSSVPSVKFIKTILALNDPLTRDAIEGAAKRYSAAVLTDSGMELRCDENVVCASIEDFLEMLDAGILGFTRLEVTSNAYKSSAALIEHSEMPTLRELKFSVSVKLCKMAVQLMSAIIHDNVNNLRVLDQVPVWLLAKPLPALHLERYIYSSDTFSSLSATNRPTKLINCFLANVHATEIRFCNFIAFQDLPPELNNSHVQRVCFDVRDFSRHSHLEFPLTDIQALLRFFPSLTRIQISVIGELRLRAVKQELSMLRALHQRFVSTCRHRQVEVETAVHYELRKTYSNCFTERTTFTRAFVMREYKDLQNTLALFDSSPAEIKLQADLHVSCWDSPSENMKEAHSKVAELGFRRGSSQESIVYMQRFDIAPGKHVNVRWEVEEEDWSTD